MKTNERRVEAVIDLVEFTQAYDYFNCYLKQSLAIDPVTISQHPVQAYQAIVFSRAALNAQYDKTGRCPITQLPLALSDTGLRSQRLALTLFSILVLSNYELTEQIKNASEQLCSYYAELFNFHESMRYHHGAYLSACQNLLSDLTAQRKSCPAELFKVLHLLSILGPQAVDVPVASLPASPASAPGSRQTSLSSSPLSAYSIRSESSPSQLIMRVVSPASDSYPEPLEWQQSALAHSTANLEVKRSQSVQDFQPATSSQAPATVTKLPDFFDRTDAPSQPKPLLVRNYRPRLKVSLPIRKQLSREASASSNSPKRDTAMPRLMRP